MSYAEEHRDLTADFQETFSTPSGARVLDHILTKILHHRAALNDGRGPITGEKALYMGALKDVAIAILDLIDYDFREKKINVIRNKRDANR